MATRFFNAFDREGKALEFVVVDGRFAAINEPLACENEVDLNGGTVLPGFIDAHCHILPMGFEGGRLNLDGLDTHEQILEAIADRVAQSQHGEWVDCTYYDQNRLPGGEHIKLRDLDEVAPDNPVFIRHVARHSGVANSCALQAASVGHQTEDPPGGTFVRSDSGELTGVLLETAYEHMVDSMPRPGLEEMIQACMTASEEMSQLGITAASDMMTGFRDLEMELQAYHIAASRGAKTRYRLYLQWSTVFGPRALAPARLQGLIDQMDSRRCKVAGIKIFADGAIGSATAATYKEFKSGGTGKLIYNPERLSNMVKVATDAGWPVAVHAIGDRAVDHVLDAFEASGAPSRHRLEHAMILSDAQIARIADTGCHVTFQPEFLSRLTEAYQAQLPDDVFPMLKRAASCQKAGIPLSFNSDRPIVGGEPWLGIEAAVQREGYDKSEVVEEQDAFDYYTKGGAEANDDEENQGRIQPGFEADFQVYEGNPLNGGTKNLSSVWVGGAQMQDS